MPSTYSEKLRDPRWQKKRLKILERDGFKCRDCGSKTKTLEVHHTYYAKGEPWDTPDEFLMAVCCSCHPKRDAAEKELKLPFLKLLADTSLNSLQERAKKIASGDGITLMHRSRFARIRESLKVLVEELL